MSKKPETTSIELHRIKASISAETRDTLNKLSSQLDINSVELTGALIDIWVKGITQTDVVNAIAHVNFVKQSRQVNIMSALFTSNGSTEPSKESDK